MTIYKDLKFTRIKSTDGLELSGAFYHFGNNYCVIHVHGLAGNFYKSKYFKSMSKYYNKKQYDFFSFNNRGAEFIKKIENIDTGKKTLYGYSYEIFEDCDKDIIGAIAYIKHLGYKKIILQGHSSGCQKIMYTVNKHNLNSIVEKIILISPCDDIGLAINKYGQNEFDKKITYAQKYKQKKLLPIDFFFNIPISKETFLSHFGHKNKFNIFHYHDTAKKFDVLKNNSLKTHIIFGEHDYILNKKIIINLYKTLKNYDVTFIKDANHSYKTQENTLAKTIYEKL